MPLLKPLICLLVLAAAAPAVHAAERAAIDVVQPWSRPAMAGMNGAGFMTLVNRGKAADALTGANSPLARKVELHRSSIAGGVASMQHVHRLAIPAGARVTFAPGGHHLMLIGLTKQLRPGDAVPVTLTFASGATKTVNFAVGSGAPPARPHAHH